MPLFFGGQTRTVIDRGFGGRAPTGRMMAPLPILGWTRRRSAPEASPHYPGTGDVGRVGLQPKPHLWNSHNAEVAWCSRVRSLADRRWLEGMNVNGSCEMPSAPTIFQLLFQLRSGEEGLKRHWYWYSNLSTHWWGYSQNRMNNWSSSSQAKIILQIKTKRNK